MSKQAKQLIGSIVGYAFIAILILYIILQLVAPNATVRVFGFKPYVVITESMAPVIDVNDIVVVRRFKVENAEVGDIITFEADIDYNNTDEVVTHYIYSITEDNGTYYIRTNRYFEEGRTVVPDTWNLTQDDVLGAYWFQIPLLGYVVEFVRSPFGIAAMVVNVGVIVGIVILLKNGKAEEPTPEPESKD